MISDSPFTCHITTYPCALRSRDGRQMQASWPTLVEALTFFRPRTEKKLAPCWAPHSLIEGNRRKIANIKEISLLVLDFDGTDASVEKAIALFPGKECVAHASYSATPTHQKCRLIAPLAHPIPADIWPRVYALLCRALSVAADTKCGDASRLFLLPMQPADPTCAMATHSPGALLDLRPLADLARAEAAREEAALSARRQRARAEWAHLHRVASASGPLARRAQARLLATSPDARLALASDLDMGITVRQRGRIAHGATCPGCGRPSVWWAIDNEGSTSAFCNHTNSCGWMGALIAFAMETL
jgi:hypothetical protein